MFSFPLVAGTSANAVHFQAYLVEGLTRWNAARGEAALLNLQQSAGLRLHDTGLQYRLNELAGQVGMQALFPAYRPPAAHTGKRLRAYLL